MIVAQAKHTPGPWIARRAVTSTDGGYDWGIGAHVDGSHKCIAEAFEVVDHDKRCPAEANARLIAAAPALYSSLKALHSFAKSRIGEMDVAELEEFSEAGLAIALAESQS